MFQTINHTHGHIQLSTYGNNTIIIAWSHGVKLGDYKTIPAAKRAITLYHRKWLETMQHNEYFNSLYA